MPLTADETSSLIHITDQLGSFKNRNSRIIGVQFRTLPDRDSFPNYYKTITSPRCLDMVKAALQSERYADLSQVYADLVAVFRSVLDTANRSSVTFRDATKMLSALDEAWTNEKTLPPITSLDPSVRQAAPESDSRSQRDASFDSAAKAEQVSRAGSLVPVISTDKVHATTVVPSTVMTAPAPVPASVTPANAPSPLSRATVNMPTTPAQTPSTSTPMTPVASGPTIPNSQSTQAQVPSLPIVIPPLGEGPPVDLPIVLPQSIMSRESRKRLDEQQADILSTSIAHASRRKRKRDADTVPDTSTGYLQPKEHDEAQKQFFLDVLARLRSERDPQSGRGLCGPINALPPMDKFPQFYQVVKEKNPSTLQSVEKHLRTKVAVPDPSDFDAEMAGIFANARLWPTTGLNSSDGEALPGFYGDTLTLQRLYNEITKGNGDIIAADTSVSSVASVPYGPGAIPLEQEQQPDETYRNKVLLPSNRIATHEKQYLDSVNFKNEEQPLQIGDFIHLYNPSSPKLPIIAQIFNIYEQKGSDQRYLRVNWYYRPSQTVHRATRTFYEQEVFKTSLFIDHKLEDFLERVCVMYVDTYTKGRYDDWTPELPTFVVEHRYDIETQRFRRIEDWTMCIPQDTLPDDSRLALYIDSIPAPHRIKSPFQRTSNITGPGRNDEPLVPEATDQAKYYVPLEQWPANAGQVVGYAKMLAQKKLGDAPTAILTKRKQSNTVKKAKAIVGNGIQAADLVEPTSQAEHLALEENFEVLPDDLRAHFRTNEATGDLLWFAVPPLDLSKDQPAAPKHSLDYLAHMAKQLGY